MDKMIQINKSEREIINKKFPRAHIVRTMKNDSRRHHYYCEETKQILHLLNSIRNGSEN